MAPTSTRSSGHAPSAQPTKLPTKLPGTPGLLRSINDRAVFELLLDHGPQTRAQLGAITGLSKPTIAQVLQRLDSHDLITITGEATTSRGPNAALYHARADLELGLGVELLPDGARVRLVDAANTVLASVTIALPEAGAQRSPVGDMRTVLNAICEEAIARGHEITPDNIGIWTLGLPGAIDPSTDALAFLDALPGWPEAGALDELRSEFGVRILAENDVNLAAVAERAVGNAKELDSFAMLWIGAGLGMALDLGGVLHRGASGGAGEIGYLPVTLTDSSKSPGRDLQDLLGPEAIRELASTHGITGESYSEILEATTPDDTAFWSDIARRAVAGLVPVLAIVDPGAIVLGGPVGAAGGETLARITAEHIVESTRWHTPVGETSLNECAVAIGGAYVASRAARELLVDSLGVVAAQRPVRSTQHHDGPTSPS